jgi:hypothetical protein
VKGIEAVKANILAAKTVSRILRSSLGPKGMDKMLQSPDGDITISERRRARAWWRPRGRSAARPSLAPPGALPRRPGARWRRARRAWVASSLPGPGGAPRRRLPPAPRRTLV